MVLRIEYILLISLGVLSFFIFIEKPHSIKLIESNCSKEALFREFSLVDINQNGIKNELIASEGIKYRDYFEAKYINITHEKIYHVIAQKAIYIKNLVSLENNITLKKDNKMEFQTNSLKYNMKKKIAYTEDGFMMNTNGTTIRGTNLKYDLSIGKISADKIHASMYPN